MLSPLGSGVATLLLDGAPYRMAAGLVLPELAAGTHILRVIGPPMVLSFHGIAPGGGGGFGSTQGGGGGGGGAWIALNLTLNPGPEYWIRVGASAAAGADGEDTWLIIPSVATIVQLQGGRKGGSGGSEGGPPPPGGVGGALLVGSGGGPGQAGGAGGPAQPGAD